MQEVEYVKEEDKLAYLLDVLQKTAPPVLVFAENKKVCFFFLLLRVCVVCIVGCVCEGVACVCAQARTHSPFFDSPLTHEQQTPRH